MYFANEFYDFYETFFKSDLFADVHYRYYSNGSAMPPDELNEKEGIELYVDLFNRTVANDDYIYLSIIKELLRAFRNGNKRHSESGHNGFLTFSQLRHLGSMMICYPNQTKAERWISTIIDKLEWGYSYGSPEDPEDLVAFHKAYAMPLFLIIAIAMGHFSLAYNLVNKNLDHLKKAFKMPGFGKRIGLPSEVPPDMPPNFDKFVYGYFGEYLHTLSTCSTTMLRENILF